MSTDMYGMAVMDACEQILDRLRPVREQLGGDTVDWKTVVSSAFFQRVNLSAQGFYIVNDKRCGYGTDPPPPPIHHLLFLTVIRLEPQQCRELSQRHSLQLLHPRSGVCRGRDWLFDRRLVYPSGWCADGSGEEHQPGAGHRTDWGGLHSRLRVEYHGRASMG